MRALVVDDDDFTRFLLVLIAWACCYPVGQSTVRRA